MPILQDVLAKLKENGATTTSAIDVSTIEQALAQAGHKHRDILHALESLRAANIIELSENRIRFL